MKKIETMVPITQFQASDGKVFKFENECLIYEAKKYIADNELFNMKVNGIVRRFFLVKTKEELETICRGIDSVEYTGGTFLHDCKLGEYDKYIGNIVAIGYRDNDDMVDDVYFESLEELITTINDQIKKLEGHISFINKKVTEIND